jgi:hypothetical protein
VLNRESIIDFARVSLTVLVSTLGKRKRILSGLRKNDIRLFASLHAAQNMPTANELTLQASFIVHLQVAG